MNDWPNCSPIECRAKDCICKERSDIGVLHGSHCVPLISHRRSLWLDKICTSFKRTPVKDQVILTSKQSKLIPKSVSIVSIHILGPWPVPESFGDGRRNSWPFTVASMLPSSSSSVNNARSEHFSESTVALDPLSGTSKITGIDSLSRVKVVNLARSPVQNSTS